MVVQRLNILFYYWIASKLFCFYFRLQPIRTVWRIPSGSTVPNCWVPNIPTTHRIPTATTPAWPATVALEKDRSLTADLIWIYFLTGFRGQRTYNFYAIHL